MEVNHRDSLIKKIKKPTPFIALVFLAVTFMATAIFMFSDLIERQKVLAESVQEGALWAVYQLDREALKFKSDIELLEKNVNQEALASAQGRFDILYSRVALIEKGQVNEFFSRVPGIGTFFENLKRQLNLIDQQIFRDVSFDVETVLVETETLQKEIETLILSSLALKSQDKVTERSEAINLYVELAICLALLASSMVFIIAMLFSQLAITRRLYKKEKDLSQDLEKAVQSAESALRVKSDFLALMSHEIRTPLNSIVGFSHLFIDDNLDSDQGRKVEKIRRSAEGLVCLLNNILDFSKLDSNKVALEEAPYFLDDVLEEVYYLNKDLVESKGVSFLVSRDFRIPNVLLGDKIKIQQILTNLIGNAAKFTHEGAIRVSVGFDQKMLTIEVKDTGIGISDDVDIFDEFTQADSSTSRLYGGTGLGLSISKKLAQLMSGDIHYKSELNFGSSFIVTLPYKQAEDGESHFDQPLSDISIKQETVSIVQNDDEVKGLLTSCHFSNYIEIKSEEVSRSEFPVIASAAWVKEIFLLEDLVPSKGGFYFITHRLGLKQEFSSSLLTPSEIKGMFKRMFNLERKMRNLGQIKSKEEKLLGVNILLAEDNKINAEITTVILEKEGATVDWVVNGEKAVESVQLKAYDVILMDMRMPVMDGFESSDKVAKRLGAQKPPIIILTADAISTKKEVLSFHGVDDVLFKPSKPHLLIETVDLWHRRSKEAQLTLTIEKPTTENNSIFIDHIASLEEMLLSGECEADKMISEIIKEIRFFHDVSLLNKAAADIKGYEYQDALLKVQTFKTTMM